MAAKTIRTTDIYFAASLIAMGAKLESVDKSDPRHMEFTLSESPNNPDFDFVELEQDWLNQSEIMGILYKMSEAVKRMKAVVHST